MRTKKIIFYAVFLVIILLPSMIMPQQGLSAPAPRPQQTPLPPNSAQIAGQVIAEDSGEPLVGIKVTIYQIYNWYGEKVGETFTDENGDYHILIQHENAGNFPIRCQIDFWDPSHHYLGETYNNDRTGFNPTLVTLEEGQSITIDASLDREARVTGRVTDQSDRPLANIWVHVFLDDEAPPWKWGRFDAWAQTDDDGVYLVQGQGLVGTYYKLRFSSPHQRYLSEYYNDHLNREDADDVYLAENKLTRDIDAALTRASLSFLPLQQHPFAP